MPGYKGDFEGLLAALEAEKQEFRRSSVGPKSKRGSARGDSSRPGLSGGQAQAKTQAQAQRPRHWQAAPSMAAPPFRQAGPGGPQHARFLAGEGPMYPRCVAVMRRQPCLRGGQRTAPHFRPHWHGGRARSHPGGHTLPPTPDRWSSSLLEAYCLAPSSRRHCGGVRIPLCSTPRWDPRRTRPRFCRWLLREGRGHRGSGDHENQGALPTEIRGSGDRDNQGASATLADSVHLISLYSACFNASENAAMMSSGSSRPTHTRRR